MKKVVSVVVASRANYGRIKSVIAAINSHPLLELDLIVCASALLYRFGDVVPVIQADGYRINHKIYSVVEGESHCTMVKSTALLMSELSSYFEMKSPDYVLTVADRHETLATAISASYLNIPLAHTQGGEQTGSIDDKVRHAISKLANIHFPATELSRKLLLSLGEDERYVFNTGCPALDLVQETDLAPLMFTEPNKGSGCNIDFLSDYGLIVYHPVTDSLEEVSPVIYSLIHLICTSKFPYIWLWPNVDAGSDLITQILRKQRDSNSSFAQNVRFVRSYTPEDYLRALSNAQHVVGNSSSFIRECSLLAVPALLIGERQRSREVSSNVMSVPVSDLHPDNIHYLIDQLPLKASLEPSSLYSHGHAGSQIANILADVCVDSKKIPIHL